MKAVVTVVGRDTVGILAKVSASCAEHNANIIDVTQSVMQELFTMVMLVDITDIKGDFSDLQNTLYALGDSIGMKIHVMHEDIFNSMHNI
ncbi:MAG: ACT domain-containing protein [Clostridia bacterium]|nr:ACT domain-containing protein [Clostridia bacterium]